MQLGRGLPFNDTMSMDFEAVSIVELIVSNKWAADTIAYRTQILKCPLLKDARLLHIFSRDSSKMFLKTEAQLNLEKFVTRAQRNKDHTRVTEVRNFFETAKRDAPKRIEISKVEKRGKGEWKKATSEKRQEPDENLTPEQKPTIF